MHLADLILILTLSVLILGSPVWMAVSLFLGGHHLQVLFWVVAVTRDDGCIQGQCYDMAPAERAGEQVLV